MGDPELTCDEPGCALGPCREAGRWLLADEWEVPLGCPNRVTLPDPLTQSRPFVMGAEPRCTPRAATILSTRPRRDLDDVVHLVQGNVLALLELRVPHPIRSGGRERPEPGPLPPPVPPVPPGPTRSWIEIELVDQDSQPVPGERYVVKLPDGTLREGRLNDRGFAREDGFDPGMCSVGFPGLAPQEWKRA
jgi:hypothetical protein